MMFTNRFFWPVYGALVLMLASCADGGKYVNALPEDAAAVVAVNLEQMAGKSGADKSTVEAAVGALKSEMRGAEGLIDRIVEDPSESGLELTDKVYFQKVYREAVELCAYLCKQYDLTEQDIICHSEGYKKGIASNHGDVMHWFPKHSKSMDAFRAEVKAELDRLEKSLADNTAASWSADAVNWAVSSGLMAGDANGNLMLRSPLTREQFCVMLKRYHDQFHTA